MRILFKRVLPLLFLSIVLIFNDTPICYANSPPPPSIFVIVPNAPKDLVLTIGSVQAERKDKAFESYFGFFFKVGSPIDNNLEVTTGNDYYQIKLPALKSYNNTFTLDLMSKTLTPGTSPVRPYQFASITII